MILNKELNNSIEDVAKQKLLDGSPIDLVGIQNLQIPIQLDNGFYTPVKSSIFVSLDDPHTRGIHMSRIYLAFHEYFKKNKLNFSNLETILEKIIDDQQEISSCGKIKVAFDYATERKSLLSDLSGWRVYPASMEIQKLASGELSYVLEMTVTYSSTCPCSASLSKQIIKDTFEKDFPQENIENKEDVLSWMDKKSLAATPHVQRSEANIRLKVSKKMSKDLSLLDLIDKAEQSLGTAVQVAVKRQDEAEFARTNAQNLMFCEDAIRKLINCFKNNDDILDYFIQVQHHESLHPFTVESSVVKGVKDGWKC